MIINSPTQALIARGMPYKAATMQPIARQIFMITMIQCSTSSLERDDCEFAAGFLVLFSVGQDLLIGRQGTVTH